jgi:hypothetical protein
MGVHFNCNGGSQDLPDESPLYDWDNPDTYLDHTSCHGAIRLVPGSKYQFLGTCVWPGFWLWM